MADDSGDPMQSLATQAATLETLPLSELSKLLLIAHGREQWMQCSLLCTIIAKKGMSLGHAYLRRSLETREIQRKAEGDGNHKG